jgi:hypothetical protein
MNLGTGIFTGEEEKKKREETEEEVGRRKGRG